MKINRGVPGMVLVRYSARYWRKRLACGGVGLVLVASAPTLALSANPANEAQSKTTAAISRKNKKDQSSLIRSAGLWAEKTVNDPVALWAFATACFTLALAYSTRQLWKASTEALTTTEKAFVFLDGFTVELTTAADQIKKDHICSLFPNKISYRLRNGKTATNLHLFVTRFAIQPRWKNGGRSPTKNMRYRINVSGPTRTSPGFTEYRFDRDPTKFFVPPNGVEGGEFLEIPSWIPNEIINDGAPPSPELFIFVWGKAEYMDVFGQKRWTKWCYKIRFDAHKGDRLGVRFIQWGDYNGTEEDTKE